MRKYQGDKWTRSFQFTIHLDSVTCLCCVYTVKEAFHITDSGVQLLLAVIFEHFQKKLELFLRSFFMWYGSVYKWSWEKAVDLWLDIWLCHPSSSTIVSVLYQNFCLLEYVDKSIAWCNIQQVWKGKNLVIATLVLRNIVTAEKAIWNCIEFNIDETWLTDSWYYFQKHMHVVLFGDRWWMALTLLYTAICDTLVIPGWVPMYFDIFVMTCQ